MVFQTYWKSSFCWADVKKNFAIRSDESLWSLESYPRKIAWPVPTIGGEVGVRVYADERKSAN
jgi:hypothetical protein